MSQIRRTELVSLAESCFEKKHFTDVIGYMKKVVKMKTPLNFYERSLLLNSYDDLKEPFFNTYNSCECSSLNEKLREELQKCAKTAINRISDEAIELLDSQWVKNDTSFEALAHYRGSRAVQFHQKAYVASGDDKENGFRLAFALYKEASTIAEKHLNPAHPVTLYIADSYRKCHLAKALAISEEACEKGHKCLSELSDEYLKCESERLLKTLSKHNLS